MAALLSAPAPARNQTAGRPDRDYIAALATAHRFLYAWQSQDPEAGLILLTGGARRGTTENRLQTYFVPGPAAQRSYEISRGRRLKNGRYSFPVSLLELGKNHREVRPRSSQIVVVRTGKDDWAVDKLP